MESWWDIDTTTLQCQIEESEYCSHSPDMSHHEPLGANTE